MEGRTEKKKQNGAVLDFTYVRARGCTDGRTPKNKTGRFWILPMSGSTDARTDGHQKTNGAVLEFTYVPARGCTDGRTPKNKKWRTGILPMFWL